MSIRQSLGHIYAIARIADDVQGNTTPTNQLEDTTMKIAITIRRYCAWVLT